MGGAHGSRECAPDDKLRDTHRMVAAITHAAGDGFRKGSTASCGLSMSFQPGQIGRFLVRECDDDQETDHDKSDQISIKHFKPFPIHMDVHERHSFFPAVPNSVQRLAVLRPPRHQLQKISFKRQRAGG
jgi:hypothetical protein